MLRKLHAPSFSMPALFNSHFRPFRLSTLSPLVQLPLTIHVFQNLRVPRVLAVLLPWKSCNVRMNCEALMWRVTTRDFAKGTSQQGELL
jgi:hypothetical protein